jgi:hypothetical protein
MRRRLSSNVVRGLELLAVSSCLLLQGCPLSDDYYVDPSLAGGSGGTSGSGGKSMPSAGAGECPDCPVECVWGERPGTSYLICPIERVYSEAEATCAAAGMRLVIIDDKGEGDWVTQTLDREYRGTQPFGFMGASDRESEGEWHFADGMQFWSGEASGDSIGSHYINWDVEQPNDRSPVTTTEEDCGAVIFPGGKWNDVRCELPCPFVCESP